MGKSFARRGAISYLSRLPETLCNYLDSSKLTPLPEGGENTSFGGFQVGQADHGCCGNEYDSFHTRRNLQTWHQMAGCVSPAPARFSATK
jgi:hypothetical protein